MSHIPPCCCGKYPSPGVHKMSYLVLENFSLADIQELLRNASKTGLGRDQQPPELQYKQLRVFVQKSLKVDLYRFWIRRLLFKKKTSTPVC